MNLRNCSILFFLLISSAINVFGQTDEIKERIRDYNVAKKALEENIQKKDIKAICLSLKHRDVSLNIKAADALGSIRSKEAVECLTEKLTEKLKYNKVFPPIDDEAKAHRNELNGSLIEALKAITELDIPSKKIYSNEDVEKIIPRIKEWQKKHRNR